MVVFLCCTIEITPAPMRSSVSVILSSPAPDTRMSHPDYDQIAQDHASILILVHHQGWMSFALF